MLPSDDNPELSVYADAQRGQWIVEDAEGMTRDVEHRGIVSTKSDRWRLELPVAVEATPMIHAVMTLDTVDLRFAVSQDEETVEITITHRGVETRLEPREHGYVLLVLARCRREDAEKGVALEDRGWRSTQQLTKMLRIEPSSINVAIHRARLQLATAGMETAAGVVEVQRRQRRFGTDRFEVVRLGE